MSIKRVQNGAAKWTALALGVLVPSVTPAAIQQQRIDAPGGGQFAIEYSACDGERPYFRGSIRNETGSHWEEVSIRLVQHGSISAEYGYPVRLGPLSNTAIAFEQDGSNRYFSTCDQIHHVTVELVSAKSAERDQIEAGRITYSQQKTRIANANARKRAASAAAARAAALAKLPILNSGTPAAFLGSDRKCARQFQEALGMDGLEKRKRIAELISFGCGVLVDSPIRVAGGQREADFVLVTIADGKYQGKSGWVPAAWLKP